MFKKSTKPTQNYHHDQSIIPSTCGRLCNFQLTLVKPSDILCNLQSTMSFLLLSVPSTWGCNTSIGYLRAVCKLLFTHPLHLKCNSLSCPLSAPPLNFYLHTNSFEVLSSSPINTLFYLFLLHINSWHTIQSTENETIELNIHFTKYPSNTFFSIFKSFLSLVANCGNEPEGKQSIQRLQCAQNSSIRKFWISDPGYINLNIGALCTYLLKNITTLYPCAPNRFYVGNHWVHQKS